MTKNPIEYKRRELEALCGRHRVERLALFGSALRDDGWAGEETEMGSSGR